MNNDTEKPVFSHLGNVKTKFAYGILYLHMAAIKKKHGLNDLWNCH